MMLPILINQQGYEGIYFFLAILSGIIILIYQLRSERIPVEPVIEGVFYSLIAALITGRLFSFLFWYPELLFRNPLIFFMPWKGGGITVIGGVVGGLCTGLIYAGIRKMDFIFYMKFIILSILAAQIIGRFGCFLNGDASGSPTDLPWGLIYAPESAAYIGLEKGLPLHPTQLYEIAGNSLLLAFLILTSNRQWITQRRLVWYLIGHSTLRFLIEFLRNDTTLFFSSLTGGQIISLAILIIGILLLILSLYKPDLFKMQLENKKSS